MDFVTHTLVGAGAARLISPRREWLPQLSLAAILGGLLQDADSWLYLLGPNFYGKYHRVVSHTLWGLGLIGVASATIAWGVAGVRPWRRFGWFVSDNLPADPPAQRAPFGWLLCAALAAAYVHWLGDVITGFGNIEPFWPWSSYDASLHAVSSFDWFIFLGTMGWHVTLRQLDWPRRREAMVTTGYLVIVTVYVLCRMKWGSPTVW